VVPRPAHGDLAHSVDTEARDVRRRFRISQHSHKGGEAEVGGEEGAIDGPVVFGAFTEVEDGGDDDGDVADDQREAVLCEGVK
jgi:hypothetical protein